GAAIYFGVALLATVALDLARGHAVHADGNQLVAHLVELERLDDGDDQFHDFIPDKLWPAPRRRKVPRRRGPAQYQKFGRLPPRREGFTDVAAAGLPGRPRRQARRRARKRDRGRSRASRKDWGCPGRRGATRRHETDGETTARDRGLRP